MEKVWLISVNMGYGHQRTTFPLKHLAFEQKIIPANNYQGIPENDKGVWGGSRRFYEFISRFKRIPLVGRVIFSLYDEFQKILSFYPKRDLSKPNFQLRQTYSLIKKGWGKHLIKKLKKEKSLPFLTSFFIPAFMAEIFKHPGEIFCIICDADIARTWAPLNPKKSKIKYFAPTQRVVERLRLYGVKEKNIFLTGYPLPLENIGSEKLEIVKKDLANRIFNLDPQKRYQQYYEPLIKKYVGKLPQKSDHLLTIMFAVGGAGAQKEIGARILKSLRKRIKERKIKIILVAGTREEVKEFFLDSVENLNLRKALGKNIEIIFEKNIEDYFQTFNQALRKTDILWTKPSEISFYCALGLPIIIAPIIGSQEDFNKKWLLRLGAGISQENPAYTDQWLFDLLERGWFAEAAMQGFIEGEKLGTFKIERTIKSA